MDMRFVKKKKKNKRITHVYLYVSMVLFHKKKGDSK